MKTSMKTLIMAYGRDQQRTGGQWVGLGILLSLLLLLAACAPAPAADTGTVTEAPAAAEATAAPTEAAMAEATAEPTEEAMAEATAEPTEEPAEEAVAEATAAPTEEPAEEAAAEMGGATFAYVGTYTRGAPGGWSDAAEAQNPEGIAVFAVDGATGDMTPVQTVPSDNPSFVAIHPSHDYLYVTNEIADFEGAEAGSIEAYSIDDATGELTLINRIAIGSIPAQLVVDPTGSYIVIANYVGGSFQLLSINEDGSLGEVLSTVEQSGSGPNTDRQEAPHPHAVAFDPSGNYIATADLGTDQVQIFEIVDDELVLVDGTTVAPGSGPRHVAFHPNGNFLYVINELTAMISVFEFNADDGTLGEEIQSISTVDADFPEHKSTAEIMVHPSGRFLYGSNRKFEDHPQADAIVGFSIDEATGMLTLIGHTTENIQFPRAFNFDPTGTWLYALNQKGDSIVQFEISQETGELTPTGVIIDTPVPVSLVFKTQ
jgi:6-phosphogluconolactonase (cycloisomerase 2 family)